MLGVLESVDPSLGQMRAQVCFSGIAVTLSRQAIEAGQPIFVSRVHPGCVTPNEAEALTPQSIGRALEVRSLQTGDVQLFHVTCTVSMLVQHR